MNLYEIEESILQAMQLFEAGDLTEGELIQALGTLEEMTRDKVDNIACYIKSLNAEAKALKEEEENLSNRRKSKENQAERLKEYIKNCLITREIKKLETTRNIISIAKTPGNAVISDQEAFINWASMNNKDLLKVDIRADISKIKGLIKDNETIPYVTIETGTRLNIK